MAEPRYDPYIPAGGSGAGGSAQYDGGNPRTAAIQSVGLPATVSPGFEHRSMPSEMVS